MTARKAPSTEVAAPAGGALTITEGQQQFTNQQVAALTQLGVQDASPADLDIFFHQAVRTGLDPFARQIYMIGRRSKDQRTGEWITKQTIQTGIDGFRLIARRAADARGEAYSVDDTLWADPDGRWHDLWIWDTPPAAAKVTVHLGAASFSAVAATREYMPTRWDKKDEQWVPTGQWARMPAVMIAKCAEALALRKAFPMDLSGVYTGEEMQQADAQVDVQVQPAPQPAQQPAPEPAPARMTGEQLDQIQQLAQTLGRTQTEVEALIPYVTQGREPKRLDHLSEAGAAAVIDYMLTKVQEQPAQGEVLEGEIVDDDQPTLDEGVES